MFNNILLNTDSYKYSHWKQYPDNAEAVSSYIESRGGAYKYTLFFGLQAFLMEYLEGQQVTKEKIDEAETIVQDHGLPFNRAGWEYILEQHGGNLPIEISAVAEGTVLPTKNVLVQVINTDPKCFWLTSFLETALLRAIWYPTTVATVSYHLKGLIKKYLEETSDNVIEQLPFKLHDFGYRGVSSLESGALGGCAHLVNFMGTDTVGALLAARKYYDEPMAGFSIPAAEHSTITSWGKKNEQAAFENMVKQFGGEGKLLAVVSDSYDIQKAVDQFWGKDLKDLVKRSGATVVVRPDSGDPVEVNLQVVKSLMESYGYSMNSKGYRVLNPAIRIIQGDGVNKNSIKNILEAFKKDGISTENIAFGMGGALLQRLDRDTLSFAMKCSAIQINGVWRDVYKEPVTDPNKDSKRGRLALIRKKRRYQTIRQELINHEFDLLQPVFRNGVVLKKDDLKTIRQRAA